MATGTRIPTMKDWSFGRRLREARDLAGLSQAEMADQLEALAAERGIPYKAGDKAINRWEHDDAQPRNMFSVIELWSDITGVDELWLIKGDEWAASDSNREPAESMLTLWELEDCYLKSA